MAVRGIRGAITVKNDTPNEIIEETTLLLKEMIEKNNVKTDEICSIFFTVTQDLKSEFPAVAARKLGLTNTPLLCMTEIPVEKALKKVIRILIQFNTDLPQKNIQHIYLKDAIKLRPDLNKKTNTTWI